MRRREWHFVATMGLAHGVQHFFMRLLPPLIPVWGTVFGYPLWKLGLLLGAMSFGNAVGQAPLGVLSDRYDGKYILGAGIGTIGACFVVFAAAPIVAPDIQWVLEGYVVDAQYLLMFVSIFLSGIGMATLHPTGYPLITANMDETRKGKALGVWGSGAKFGDGLAPAAVGVLLLVVSWDNILFTFGLLAIVFAFVLFSMLEAYDTAPEGRGKSDDAPDVDVWRIDRRLYVYPMLLIFLFFAIRGIGANGVNVFIPEFITSVYGYSLTVFGYTVTAESTASLYYSALMLTAGFVQLGTGVLVDRYDGRVVILGFLSVSAIVLGVLSVATLSPAALFFVLILFGGAMWGMAPARDRLISEITPEAREGRTFGYLWTGIGLVSAASPVIIGYIGEVAGLREAFVVLSVAIVVSAIPIALLFSGRVYLQSEQLTTETTGD
jgi:MFS family permease